MKSRTFYIVILLLGVDSTLLETHNALLETHNALLDPLDRRTRTRPCRIRVFLKQFLVVTFKLNVISSHWDVLPNLNQHCCCCLLFFVVVYIFSPRPPRWTNLADPTTDSSPGPDRPETQRELLDECNKTNPGTAVRGFWGDPPRKGKHSDGSYSTWTSPPPPPLPVRPQQRHSIWFTPPHRPKWQIRS